MNSDIRAKIDRIVAIGSGDPASAMTALAELAEECERKGLKEEQVSSLLAAVRLGTSRSLARVALDQCMRLIHIAPRLIFIRHLALLHELSGNMDAARHIYLWIASLAIDRGIDLVENDELQSLLAPDPRRAVFDSIDADDRRFKMLLKFARACLTKGRVESALASVDSALALRPGDPDATELRAKILEQK